MMEVLMGENWPREDNFKRNLTETAKPIDQK